MRLYGVDGCRGGWLIASHAGSSIRGKTLSFALTSDLRDLFASSARDSIIAIDIPIGLAEAKSRQCDIDARQFLGPARASSVFPAPCRACVDAGSYREACERNFAASGRMISRQCYGILAKIRHVDKLMSAERQQFVREVHPEVAFALLSGRRMLHRKITQEGIAARLRVLTSYGIMLSPGDIRKWRLEIGRGQVRVDDIIDAAVCVLSAERIARGAARVFGGDERDSRNIRMEIVA